MLVTSLKSLKLILNRKTVSHLEAHMVQVHVQYQDLFSDFSNRFTNEARHESGCVSMQLLWKPYCTEAPQLSYKGSIQLLPC